MTTITRNELSSTANNHRRSNHPFDFVALGRPALRVMNRHRPMPAEQELLYCAACLFCISAPQIASCHLGSALDTRWPPKKSRTAAKLVALLRAPEPMHAAVAWNLGFTFYLKGRQAHAHACVHSGPRVGGFTRRHHPKGYEAGCLAVRGAPTNR